MATVEELLRAAKNADAAGDTEAARRLVQHAKGMMGSAPSAPEKVNTAAPAPLPGTTAAQPEAALLPPSTGQASSSPAAAPDHGALDTTRSMVADPLAATKAYAAGIISPRESAAGQNIARNSVYIPGLSDVAAGAVNLGGAALSGLHTVMAGGAGLAGDALGALGAGKNSQQQFANDLMGMVESTAGINPLAGGEAAAARAGLKADAKMTGPAGAARDLGVTPSLGMTGKTGAMAAATLEKVPFAAEMVAKDASRAVGEVEGAFRKAVPGGLSPASAGSLLQSGLKAFVVKFKDRSNQLFDKVADFIPPGTRVPVTNMQAAIANTKQYFSQNPELAQKLGLGSWDAVVAEAQKNGISWQGVRQLRTKVGDAISSDRGALAGEDIGRLKQLYGALTADMEAAARAAGKDAYGAFTRANTYYKSGAQRIERSLDATIKASNPERAFEAFDALNKADRASSDVMRMRQIKASLSRDDWSQISSSIADRLGRAKAGAQNAEGGVFSPATFLTEWNKMTPEAKRILFDEPVRVELEKIAKVSERIKASGAERNMSNTGTILASTALASAFLKAPTTTAAALGGAVISAKAMTSPIFLRAVNQAMSGDARAIEAMAKGKGPYAQDAALLMRMTASEAQSGGAANSPEAPRAAIGR